MKVVMFAEPALSTTLVLEDEALLVLKNTIVGGEAVVMLKTPGSCSFLSDSVLDRMGGDTGMGGSLLVAKR